MKQHRLMYAVLIISVIFLLATCATGRELNGQTTGAGEAQAVLTIGNETLLENVSAIGVNEFGDSGGTRHSAGNLIPGGGFEPFSMRRFWRIDQVGIEQKGSRTYSWVTIPGEGLTMWDLVTTGYFNGASYRLYRIVDESGRPLPLRDDGYLDLNGADQMVLVGTGIIPEAGAPGLPLGGFLDEPGEQRIYLDGPTPEPWDYLAVDKLTIDPDVEWSHPRFDDVEQAQSVTESWEAIWGDEAVTVDRQYHTADTPDEMAFPGESYLHVRTDNRQLSGIRGPYIFFPINESGEGNWYNSMEPGKTYRFEAWMKQDGLANDGQVDMTFIAMYEDIRASFNVGNEWQLYGFSFTAPERPAFDGWHGAPAMWFTGPGELYIDNVRLFAYEDEEEINELFVPSQTSLNQLLDSQPKGAAKGIMRSMYVMLNDSRMSSLLSPHADDEVIFDWFVGVEAANAMSLPGFLDYAERTGDRPENRMKPWLNISTRASEEEWAMLFEFLAAPIDPDDPADVQAKPWAYMRYLERGTAEPWTESFEKIIIEFANETWHNGAVMDQWIGWDRPYWIHGGSLEFGLWVRHFTSWLRENSPWYADAIDSGLVQLTMGSNYDDYAELGIEAAGDDIAAIAHANYVGPRWEQEEEQILHLSDEGYQTTLLGYIAGLDEEFAKYERFREELRARGVDYEIYGYEGGPSGYAIPGNAGEDQVEIAESYGKSQAMAVAAVDAWLSSRLYGFSEMALLAYAQGEYWSSHTSIRNGNRPHAHWLALSLLNRHATGDMVSSQVANMPLINWRGEDLPLIGSYVFRERGQLTIVLVNRSLEESFDVELDLPFGSGNRAQVYALEEDPRASNRFAMDVNVTEREINLRENRAVTLLPGSIQVIVFN